MRTLLVTLLAAIYNRLPGSLQHAVLWLGHGRFLVGVVGVGVDDAGGIVLARHRFGSAAWRLLGGMLDKGEGPAKTLERELGEELGVPVTIGPLLEVGNSQRWAHLEIVFAYRIWGALPSAPNDELLAAAAFAVDALPPMRPEHRWLVEQHAPRAVAWARTARRESP